MDSPRLAADASGHAVVGWHALVLDSRRFIRSLGVFASVWSETAGWGSLSPLSDPGVETFLIEVLLDPTGGAAAFWLKRDDDRLWVSRLSPTGTWLPSEQVPGAKALPSGMAFLANGDLLVVWADGPSVLASRRRGASWSPPETLQDGRSDPQGVIGLVALAVNDRGDALAAWTRYLERLRPTLWTSRLRAP
jgi:hypothetical protein